MDNLSDIRIVKIIDDYSVVINKGAEDGIQTFHRFLIYDIDMDPIIDPVTKKSLGNLEIVKGTAEVKHIQETMTTLISDSYIQPTRKVVKRKPNTGLLGYIEGTTEEFVDNKTLKPFDCPSVGNYAKIIR